MSPLLTTGQSRWALHILLSFLSTVAILSSAPSAAGGVSMYSGNPGDIRGPAVMIGGIGLGGSIVLRTAFIFLPKPWRIYLDRLEFAFISIIWICWTSATMAFSAFTVTEGVCAQAFSELFLPTCPLLTFDLILLHLLSVTTLALLLVVLSTALSPGYYLLNSTSLTTEDSGTKHDPENTDAFVMWDLALASPPSSPTIGPTSPHTPLTGRSYGTHSPTTPLRANPYAQPSPSESLIANPLSTSETPVVKKDKFSEGRLRSYIPILLCSVGALGATIVSLVKGSNKYAHTSAFIIIVASVSLGFAASFLIRHFILKKQAKSTSSRLFNLRNDRALEVALAGSLFMLWPLAAIIYTLFPPTPNRPCTNPAASLESEDPHFEQTDILCLAAATAVTLAWLASWLILARVMGLIVPMPEMEQIGATPRNETARGEESQSLLGNERETPKNPPSAKDVKRPQMKWGRMVAGEEFELGGGDD